MTDMVLEETKGTHYLNGRKLKWLVRTTFPDTGQAVLKYQIEGLSGLYERQFSTIKQRKSTKQSTIWDLIDELPTADWAWDNEIRRGALI